PSMCSWWPTPRARRSGWCGSTTTCWGPATSVRWSWTPASTGPSATARNCGSSCRRSAWTRGCARPGGWTPTGLRWRWTSRCRTSACATSASRCVTATSWRRCPTFTWSTPVVATCSTSSAATKARSCATRSRCATASNSSSSCRTGSSCSRLFPDTRFVLDAQDRLDAALDVELAEDRRDMVVHGAPRTAELLGDLVVRRSVEHEREDLLFPLGQAERVGARGPVGAAPLLRHGFLHAENTRQPARLVHCGARFHGNEQFQRGGKVVCGILFRRGNVGEGRRVRRLQVQPQAAGLAGIAVEFRDDGGRQFPCAIAFERVGHAPGPEAQLALHPGIEVGRVHGGQRLQVPPRALRCIVQPVVFDQRKARRDDVLCLVGGDRLRQHLGDRKSTRL